MRFILKVVLFPIAIVLAIVGAVLRFVCTFSTMLLGILSFVLFVFAVAAFIGNDSGIGSQRLLGAYLISPYGIPFLASWIVNRIDDVRDAIFSI